MTDLIEFKLDLLYLKAAVLAAAKKDVREQLNGVYFNLKNGCLQSTNGHIAFMTKPNTFRCNDEHKGFIMPIDMVKSLCAIKTEKQESLRQVSILYSPQENVFTARLNSLTVSGQVLQKPFPNFVGIYQGDKPDRLRDVVTRTYSANLLSIATKIATTLTPLMECKSKNEEPIIEFEIKDEKAILNINKNLVHLIVMGMKTDENERFQYFDLKE